MVAPGTGFVQVGWFSARHRRRRSRSPALVHTERQVVSGQSSAALTIYRNTGGNFNAPPVTNGVPVGTATLSFSTCSSGQLSYNFTDGSGRTGIIPLTRITQNVTCSTTARVRPTPTLTFRAIGTTLATSGRDSSPRVNPINGAVFVPWYTYAPPGRRRRSGGSTLVHGVWCVCAGAAFDHGADSSKPPGGVRYADDSSPASVQVGTGTLAFQSCSAATLISTSPAAAAAAVSGTIAPDPDRPRAIRLHVLRSTPRVTRRRSRPMVAKSRTCNTRAMLRMLRKWGMSPTIIGLLVALTLLPATKSAGADLVVEPVVAWRTVALVDHRPSWAAIASDLGRSPDDLWLPHLTIVLHRPDSQHGRSTNSSRSSRTRSRRLSSLARRSRDRRAVRRIAAGHRCSGVVAPVARSRC